MRPPALSCRCHSQQVRALKLVPRTTRIGTQHAHHVFGDRADKQAFGHGEPARTSHDQVPVIPLASGPASSTFGTVDHGRVHRKLFGQNIFGGPPPCRTGPSSCQTTPTSDELLTTAGSGWRHVRWPGCFRTPAVRDYRCGSGGSGRKALARGSMRSDDHPGVASPPGGVPEYPRRLAGAATAVSMRTSAADRA